MGPAGALEQVAIAVQALAMAETEALEAPPAALRCVWMQVHCRPPTTRLPQTPRSGAMELLVVVAVPAVGMAAMVDGEVQLVGVESLWRAGMQSPRITR